MHYYYCIRRVIAAMLIVTTILIMLLLKVLSVGAGMPVEGGGLEPGQMEAMRSLGVPMWQPSDPCGDNGEENAVTECDQGSPYRHVTVLAVYYCPQGGEGGQLGGARTTNDNGSSAWAALAGTLGSLSFLYCPEATPPGLPDSLRSSLRSLSLVSSFSRGPPSLQLPLWLTSFGDLYRLSLSDVPLHHSVPLHSLLSNWPHLNQVEFVGANVSGNVPYVWPSELTSIRISGNKNLGGEIPKSLSMVSELQTLDLSFNNLLGPIPNSLGSLQKLQTLKLASNQLSGEIPPSFERLTSLRILDLSGNLFNGSIPIFLRFLPNLRVLDLSNNHFSGQIPFDDTFFRGLNSFKAGHNFNLCYSKALTSAIYAKGVLPCELFSSPDIPSPGLNLLAPSPGKGLHDQEVITEPYHGPKKVVLVFAMAVLSIVVTVIIAFSISQCCLPTKK